MLEYYIPVIAFLFGTFLLVGFEFYRGLNGLTIRFQNRGYCMFLGVMIIWMIIGFYLGFQADHGILVDTMVFY